MRAPVPVASVPENDTRPSRKQLISREHFTWREILEHVSAIIGVCILCVMARTGMKIPRPFASTTHGTKPYGVLHFDYLKLGDGKNGVEYVLVIINDLSFYC